MKTCQPSSTCSMGAQIRDTTAPQWESRCIHTCHVNHRLTYIDQVDMNGTDPLRELPRSLKNPCLHGMLCLFCTHEACSPESDVELPIAVPVTHIFHLVMETPAMPMVIGSTRAHLVAISRLSAETLAHVWSVMVARLGLNDLHNSLEKPHRCP